MAALPYIQFYVADYLADTAHLTAAQHGAYLLLIFNYWQRSQPLNNSNERLANVARMSSEEWKEAKPILSEFFTIDGDMWIHHRIDSDLEAVRLKSTKASDAGKASVKSRLSKRSADVQRTFNHTDTDTDTDTEKDKNKPCAAKSPRFDPLIIDLQNCINPSDWQSWIAYRRHRKLTMSEKTITMQVSNLVEWHKSGHDPGKIINDSIANGWQGLFEPKSGAPPRKNIHDERAEVIAAMTGRNRNHEYGNIIDITPNAAPGGMG